MRIEILIQALTENAAHVRQLLHGIAPDRARWKPDPETWSLCEIVHHLLDEERDDFRATVDHLLHHPEQPWPQVEPMKWIVERRYNERDFAPALEAFLEERSISLAWLRSLDAPAWDRPGAAPWGRPTCAGEIAASWPIHDLWHIQQIVQLHRTYAAHQFAPYDVRYAGTL